MAEEFENNVTDIQQKGEAVETAESGSDEKHRLENEISTLSKDLEMLEELKKTAEQELSSLKSSISESEELNKRVQEDLSKAKNTLVEKNAEILSKQEAFKNLDKAYEEKNASLEKVLNERKRTLDIVTAERVKLEKEISALLSSLQANVGVEHESVKNIYEQTMAEAKAQLNSATSATEKILKDIQADAQKLAQSREKQAKEHLDRMRTLQEKDEELRNVRIAEFEQKLNTKLDKLSEEQEENERLRIDNVRRASSLSAKEKGFEDAVEAEIKRRYDSLIGEKNQAEEDRNYYEKQYEEVSKKLNGLMRSEKFTETVEKEALQNEIKGLEALVDDLKKQTRSSYLSDEQREKAELYDDLKRVSDQRLAEIQKLSAQVEDLKCAEGLNKTVNEIVDRYADRIDELKEQLDKFKKEDYSQEYRKKPIVDFPVFKKIADTIPETEELKWLDNIYKGIGEEGFKFSKRLIKAFHTCVKTAIWSPITVLAGVSGTGKSELPRLYSLYGGFHFLNMPVKPDWDSPASMLGYYNALERRFESKEIIRAMYQMQSDKGLNKNLALFLLDEMNLSHVELYFSDMLSKLEENRNRKNSDPVCLNIDLGAGVQPLELKLTHNMFWVGTMNEDETTKSLSDKVVDRSNIVVVPRPELLADREFKPSPAFKQVLTMEIWKKWSEEDLFVNEKYKEKFLLKTKEYKRIVQDINSNLENGGRALGHRVWQSIQHYMSAHPDVIDAFKRDAGDDEIKMAMGSAFAEAVAFKIMPKLRGIETDGKIKRDCLDKIGERIKEDVNDLFDDFNQACDSAYGVFMWKSGKFLEDKKEADGGDKN